MTDIIMERLRALTDTGCDDDWLYVQQGLLSDAADEIERLQGLADWQHDEIERLRFENARLQDELRLAVAT